MISKLEDISNFKTHGFGGKAEGLLRLHKIGALIPKTICLSISYSDIDTIEHDKNLIDPIKEWMSSIVGYKKWIIRSSHFSEDSLEASHAGIYASRIINDPHTDAIVILKNIRSLLRPVLNMYGRTSVIIQPFITGVLTGMLFTTDGNIGRYKHGMINYTLGEGSSLTDGRIKPVVVRFAEGEPIDIPIYSQEFWSKLVKIGFAIEKEWEVPIDIEFIVDSNQNLFYLQARPITSLSMWRSRPASLLVDSIADLPPSVHGHSKVQLRLKCEREKILISKAWIVTETRWNPLRSLNLPQSSYSSVLIHPHKVDEKIHRKFSSDALVGASEVLTVAKDYWVRHAIVKELLFSRLTGIATLNDNNNCAIIEVGKGHFIPKGVVDTSIYEYRIDTDTCDLIQKKKQDYYYDIDLRTGEKTNHEWGGYATLTPPQVKEIAQFLLRLGLRSGDFLEFGVGANDEIFVIDTQSHEANKSTFVANEQVISFGFAEGKLYYVPSVLPDATEMHFLEFQSIQRTITAEKIIIASQRPELGLLEQITRLMRQGKQVAGAIFGIYSPLCHLAILMREWGIPAVVSPEIFENRLSSGSKVKIIADQSGGMVVPIENDPF